MQIPLNQSQYRNDQKAGNNITEQYFDIIFIFNTSD